MITSAISGSGNSLNADKKAAAAVDEDMDENAATILTLEDEVVSSSSAAVPDLVSATATENALRAFQAASASSSSSGAYSNSSSMLQDAKSIAVGLGAVFLSTTLLVSIVRWFLAERSPEKKRQRQVQGNLQVVKLLQEYLPEKRAALTPPQAEGICKKVGLTNVLVFRKYLWFAIRERVFDTVLMDDLQQLKVALRLTDKDVSQAIKERCEKIAAKYGPLMASLEGLSSQGLQRKLALKSFVAKLVFIADELSSQEAMAETGLSFAKAFSCTEMEISEARMQALSSPDSTRSGDESDESPPVASAPQ